MVWTRPAQYNFRRESFAFYKKKGRQPAVLSTQIRVICRRYASIVLQKSVRWLRRIPTVQCLSDDEAELGLGWGNREMIKWYDTSLAKGGSFQPFWRHSNRCAEQIKEKQNSFWPTTQWDDQVETWFVVKMWPGDLWSSERTLFVG